MNKRIKPNTMASKKFNRFVLFTVSVLLINSGLFAGNERFDNRLDLTSNGYISVVDDKFVDMQGSEPSEWGFSNANSRGIVRLIFDNYNPQWTYFENISTITEVEVPVLIHGLKYNYETNSIESFYYEKTLSVSFSANGQVVKEMSSFVVDGAHQISAITLADPADYEILNFMAVEVEIEVERYYKLLASYTWSMEVASADASGKIDFEWNGIIGAEGYEIEYAFVSGQNATGGYTPGNIESYLFRFNSTRVRLTQNTFSIPNIYNLGDIVFRVRAYGKVYDEETEDYLDFYTSWSHADNTSAGAFSTIASSLYWVSEQIESVDLFDASLFNKQSMANFAEDGKSKFSVNYFDGSLRSRQSLVKLNSEDIVLVGETKYDYLGRPAVSILPVPKADDKLKYETTFNLDANSGEYTAADFDESFSPGALGNTSGAGGYYSTLNTDVDSKYIPDAEGFPFVRTIFTNDNTGRVRIQGGLGPVYQPGETIDRTTRYYYGTPQQEELDKLFGSEVGYSKYYTKEMICDPNGQKTVTYKDVKGNVIATGLAGLKPDNLLSLSSNLEENEITVNLLQNGLSESISPGEIVLTHSIMSDRAQDVDVNYLLNGTEYSTSCETQSFCMDCVYDLIISITDQDGNPVQINTTNFGVNTTVSSNALDAIDTETPTYDITGTSCNNPDYEGDISYDWDAQNSAQLHLEEGVYYITRRLVLNSQALDYYTSEYINEITSENGCLYLQDIIDQYETEYENYYDCDYTCADWQDDYADLVLYGTAQQISDFVEIGDLLCDYDENPICNHAYQAMLNDVSPNGQYGLIQDVVQIIDGNIVEPENDIVDPSTHPLSVFNEDNHLPVYGSVSRTWKHPVGGHYYSNLGTISYIDLTFSGGEYSPAADENYIIDDNGDYYVEPQYLYDVHDFLDNWEDSWAESLVAYHPEYGYWEICNDLQGSHDFDLQMLESETLAEWEAFFPSIDIDDFIADPTANDPFFASAAWPFGTGNFSQSGAILQFEDMMDEFMTVDYGEPSETTIDIWQAAYIMTEPGCAGFNCGTCNYSAFVFSSASEAYWNNFKTLYYNLKTRMREFITTQYAMENEFYNGCISLPDSWGTADGFFASGDAFDDDQFCYFINSGDYENKTPRFPGFNHLQGGNITEYYTANCYSNTTYGALDNCPEGLTDLDETMGNYTDLYFYDQCDQCPVERDLQSLFIGLLSDDELLETSEIGGIVLNCTIPEYVMDLHTLIAADPDNSMLHESQYNISSPSQSLELELTEDGTSNVCYIKMVMEDDLNSTDLSYYTFNDVVGFCCLYDYEGQFLFATDPEYDELNDFTITALVIVDSNDPDYNSDNTSATKEITVYGAISCLDFTGCEFEPICRLNGIGSQLEVGIKGADSGSQHYTTGFGPYSLGTPDAYSAFPDLIDALYNCSGGGPDDYYWSISAYDESTTYDDITISFTTSDSYYDDIEIIFDLTSATYTISSIAQVLAIEPMVAEPGKMQIKLVYSDGSDYHTEWFESNTTCLNVGECFDDQLPPNEGLFTDNSAGNYNQEYCVPTNTNIDETYIQSLVSSMFDEFLYDHTIWHCSDDEDCYYSIQYNNCRFDMEPASASGGLVGSGDYASCSGPSSITFIDDFNFTFSITLQDNSGLPEDININATCYDCFNPELSCWGDNVSLDYLVSLINPIFHEGLNDINNWTLVSNYEYNHFSDDIDYFFSVPSSQTFESEDFVGMHLFTLDAIYPAYNMVIISGQFYYTHSELKIPFSCKIICHNNPPLAATCNEQETLGLISDINTYLESYTISNSTITFNSGQADECDIEFFVPEGQYFDIDTYVDNMTTVYTAANITEIIEMAGYNSYNDFSDGTDLFDDMVDLEVYARLSDNSVRLFYANSGCFVPDCWCKKALNVPNGDFETDGDYSQGMIDYMFTTDVTNTTYVVTGGTFESTDSYTFSSGTTVTTDDNFVAYDFTAAGNYTISLWVESFELEPYTEYDFSITLHNAEDQYDDDLHIDLRDITSGYDISLFNDRAGYLSHLDVPDGVMKIYEPNTDGIYIDFDETINSTDMDEIVLRGTFYTGTRTDFDLAVKLEISTGHVYCIAMDDVILKKQEPCACEINPHPASLATVDIPNCEEMIDIYASNNAIWYYEEQVAELTETFRNDYIDYCLENMSENFTITLSLLQEGYTLYYYDLAGNLIKTVPPKGVKDIDLTSQQSIINNDRENNTNNFSTPHTMSTVYKYNTLGQLTAQYMPDHIQFESYTSAIDDREDFSMLFWYDKLGRIVASQNSKQYNSTTPVGTMYSYTLYDALGRVTESGVIDFGFVDFENSFVDPITSYVNYTSFKNHVLGSTTKSEVTKTYYDYVAGAYYTGFSIPGFTQENLRNRVSFSTIDEDGDGEYDFATFYSYDIHGNVKSLVHEIVELEDINQNFKRIDYDYDLISGNVKKVSYQTGEPDQFHHRYWYDADNRITHVETSDDNINWQQDAKYFYYKHGPLARVELGNDKVQALDYAYTLQGWLKGVNSDNLAAANDIGKDGYVNATQINPNQFVGADQFGFSLGYYQGDYTPVGGTNVQFLSDMTNSTFASAQVGLYNGNISHMVNSSRHVNDQIDVISMGFAYQYDQLNRIRNMVTYEGLDNNSWSSVDSPTASSSYTYDKNGNLETLNRSNRNSAPFDLFTYNPVDEENNNKLLSVSDAHTDPLTESTDIDYLAGPYTYDQIGNLISDPSEDIDNIEWTSSGKVRSVTRITGLEDSELHFKYDPTGNRIVKMVENTFISDQSLDYYTKSYYLRDVQGNIMAVYNRTYAEDNDDMLMSFSVVERPVYGSSRIANFTDSVQLASLNEIISDDYVYYDSPEILSQNNGTKHFELTNHLGNVMAVVSDKRTPVLNATATAIESFQPELLIAKDYYPFGMEMSGRYGGANGTEPDDEYRFGFNGKEKDDEWNGQTGSTYDFGARLYDARIGRWMAVDPMADERSWVSPYSYCQNNPIGRVDPTGALDTDEANLDWFQNEKTGEVVYHKDYGKNDAGLLGDNYSHLGEDDMFGEAPVDVYNSVMGADETETTSFGFDAETSEKFMNTKGYEKKRYEDYVHVKEIKSYSAEGLGETIQFDQVGGFEHIEKTNWRYFKNSGSGNNYNVVGYYKTGSRKYTPLPPTNTYHRYEIRRYDYSSNKHEMGPFEKSALQVIKNIPNIFK